MIEQWYFSRGGRIHGPVTRSELDERYGRGEIANTDQVRKADGAAWIPYGMLMQQLADDDGGTSSAAHVRRDLVDDQMRLNLDHRHTMLDANTPIAQQTVRSWLNAFGVHPLIATGVIAFDFMIFGGEVATGGLGGLFLAPFAGAVVFAATALVQRHSCNDSWGAAIGKALLLGTLTAIPTPLPSFVVAALGGMGYFAKRSTT